MKWLAISLLFMISFTSIAKDNLAWVQGLVVLKNKEVKVGELIIQPALNLVLFRNDKQVTYFLYDKVLYIRFHEAGEQLIRKFISYSTTDTEKGGVCTLYEVVTEGLITVIRKPKGAMLPHVADPYGYEYFTLHNNRIEPLINFPTLILPEIESFFGKSQLKHILRKEKIDPRQPDGAIRLIDLFNQKIKMFNVLTETC